MRHTEVIKPPRVREGDTVAIVSPSAPAVAWWPHRVERGRAYLQKLGLKVKIMPNANGADGWVSATPRARAEDLHTAFADDEVKVVLTSIGGNHSNQLLPHLDFDLVARHPKIFQGFSDTTVLQWAFMKHAGLSTFYGTAFTLGLAEFPEVFPYTDKYLRAAWFGGGAIRFEPSDVWTDEVLDFFEKADLSRPRELRKSEGWVPVREGTAEGSLIGGCLETICWHLKGSEHWLDLRDTILFLETSEEAPSPAHVDAYLTDLDQLGVFEQVSALIVGRPANYTPEQATTLWSVVADRTANASLPVLANVECGHTDPMLTLPLGVRARVDVGAGVFETLEPATSS